MLIVANKAIILIVVLLNFIMLSVVMLNVVAPPKEQNLQKLH
jgi:hypothetical protein